MSLSIARAMKLLRTSMLVLLVLGVMIRPVLGVVGELHGMEHAALAGHLDDHGDDHGDEGDADHALGTHGLLHQCSGIASCTLPTLPSLAVALPAPLIMPIPTASPPGEPRLGSPFRPPIA